MFSFASWYYSTVRFNGLFPGGPGLAVTRLSPFSILLELRMEEILVTTGAIRRAKLQLNCHHQPTDVQLFFQARCPSCRPTNSVKALKGKYHIPWTCLAQAHLGGHPTLSLTTNSSWLPWGGLPCLSSAL